MELFKQKLAEIQRSYAENLEKASILAEKPRELADISVTLLIPKRKARIDSFFIAPAAKTSDLSDFLLQYFAKINDPFTVFCEKTCFFLVIPAKFEKQLAQFFTNPEILWEKAQEIAEIQRFCLEKEVFLQKVVRNREIVAVFGDFRNKSDLPQECVSYNFTEKRLVDYYSCENCGIKWICQSCKEFCHKNHAISAFLLKHEVDWGCCYCSSKGFCRIASKTSKK